MCCTHTYIYNWSCISFSLSIFPPSPVSIQLLFCNIQEFNYESKVLHKLGHGCVPRTCWDHRAEVYAPVTSYLSYLPLKTHTPQMSVSSWYKYGPCFTPISCPKATHACRRYPLCHACAQRGGQPRFESSGKGRNNVMEQMCARVGKSNPPQVGCCSGSSLCLTYF